MIGIGPPAGRNQHAEQREAQCSPFRRVRYTSHEVTAPRVAGPSGRTAHQHSPVQHLPHYPLPLQSRIPHRNPSPRPPIPISRIPQIPLLAMQISMHPSPIRPSNILRNLMRLLPIPLRIPPKRKQSPGKPRPIRSSKLLQSHSSLLPTPYSLFPTPYSLLHIPTLPHPLRQQIRPITQLRIPHRQPRSMRPMLKQMHLSRNPSLHQRRIKHHAVHHRHRLVIGRREQKRRRRLLRHLRLRRQLIHQFRIRRIPQQKLQRPAMQIRLMKRNHRIRQNQKVRPRSLLLHHIARILLIRIELRPRRRRQMSPSRRSPHPHMIHRNPPLRRMSPHHPNRPLRILQFHRMVILRPQSVLQHKRRHPALIQPPRKREPLLLHRQMGIPATRSHHHPRPRHIRSHRQKHRQRRLVDILLPQSPRRTRRPQQHRLPRPALRNRRSRRRQRRSSRSRYLPKSHPTRQNRNRKPKKNLPHQVSIRFHSTNPTQAMVQPPATSKWIRPA